MTCNCIKQNDILNNVQQQKKSCVMSSYDRVSECKYKEPSEGIITSCGRMFTSCSVSVRYAGRVILSTCSALLGGLGICGQMEAVQAVLGVSGEWGVSRFLSGLPECCTCQHSAGPYCAASLATFLLYLQSRTACILYISIWIV